MRLRFSAICDEAHATPEGKLELHGVYHDLSAPGFPAKQDRLVLVLVLEWEREDHGRFRFRADLEGEDGKTSLTVEGETEVRAPVAGVVADIRVREGDGVHVGDPLLMLA